MGRARTLVAYVLMAAALATVLVLLEPPVGLQGDSEHAVLVTGPDGVLWNGTVSVDPATPLQTLLAAGEAGGFGVGVRGEGPMAYVYAVDGHAEGATGGWCYAIRAQDGHAISPATGAGAYPLEDGDAVEWYWTDDQCRPFDA